MSSKNSKGQTYGTGRTRNYATVVYLDSAPENWKQIISESKIPVFISPYHDKDFNADGTPKKPHYHVLTMFDSVKTSDQANAFFETFNGVGCEVVGSLRGYARYLCHLDNPEKARYNIDDVKAYAGADYISIIGTASDKLNAVDQMIDYIEENDITSFAELMRYAKAEKRDWFECLVNNCAYVIKEYIKSTTWEKHQKESM